jgi:hypothetical protein
MKRCPTCQSTYTDDSLGYCLTDGAASTSAAPFNPQATLPNEFQSTLRNENQATLRDDDQVTLRYPPLPPQRATDEPQAIIPKAGTPPSPGWNPQAWSPHAHQQPVPTLRRRNPTPWIVGGLVVLLLGASIVVWAIIASRGSSDEARTLTNANGGNPTASDNSNKPPTNRNSNQNSNQSTVDVDAPPTDPELVLT